MGTSTKFTIGDSELTPEECSAEMLRELFKNLPDEIRDAKGEVGTVIINPTENFWSSIWAAARSTLPLPREFTAR